MEEKIMASVWVRLPNVETAAIYNILLYLCHQHGGTCYPSIKTLSEYTKMGNKRVSKNLNKLIEIGIIQKKTRFNKSTIYRVLEPEQALEILK
jgi:predicted transcriptional regulator